MRAEAVLKEGQKKVKKAAKSIKKQVEPSWLQKKMVKLYLKSPAKVQFALAKFGIKHTLKKKKADLEEMIKH